jgi:hypothetical protein
MVRFKHSAVHYASTIFIYGGTYEFSDQIQGIVALNTSNLRPRDFERADGDQLDTDDYFGVSPLHLAVGIMLVLVLVFISMFTVLRRRIAHDQGGGGGGGGGGIFGGQSRGLTTQLIETIPIVKYGEHPATKGANSGNTEGQDCCSICLCEVSPRSPPR